MLSVVIRSKKCYHNKLTYVCFFCHSVSEEILDQVLEQIALELNETCNQFVDDVYEKEFVQSS